MNVVAPVSPRVTRVLNLIERLNAEERAQLAQLLPLDLIASSAIPEEALAEAAAYFRAKAQKRPTLPSLDDPFVGGLTYQEYFALPDEEAEALWDELASEAPSLDELPVVEVKPDARIPARQKRRSQDH